MPDDPKKKKSKRDDEDPEDDEEDDSDILEGFSDEDQADIRKAAAARHLAQRRWAREQAKNKKVEPEPKKKRWNL